MRVPSELVETLAVILDEGSLDAAARRLHITPSAVSQRIRALERVAGQVLLVRSKPARATEAAHRFVRYARQLALLERDAFAGLDDVVTSVPLAVNADSLATWFLPPLARVAATHGVVFDLHRDDQDFTAGLLESGTVTGAVTSRRIAVAGCRVSALGALRYEAVATPAFVDRWFPASAGADAGWGPDADGLASAPVVDFDRRDELQTRWLRGAGVDAHTPPRHRVPASQDFATAVLLGLGWALLPTLQSRAHVERGELVRLGGEDIVVPLYWQQWNLASPLLDAVADEVVLEARRVLEPAT
ncbi:LysR family transcriptional regulator ArgP [Microbacterium sp. cf332]|uniref:LysR family transcriptional regulator ArgP n=1 Tax=Microbacterium sp. cf332 TaxID=1761804 RepID=UPI00088AC854|nr:LysR family transcriptional regulator ArgP [Microbacterium sp. cf332]SDQ24472.1 LysR family transcriptional regulator, chromosome initiation inhibitor [Microbacterium sp. cf332]